MPWIFFANLPLNIKFFGEYAFGNLFLMFKVQIGTIFSYFYNVKAYFCSFSNKFFNRVFCYHILRNGAPGRNLNVEGMVEFDLLLQCLFGDEKWQYSIYFHNISKWCKHFKIFLVQAF